MHFCIIYVFDQMFVHPPALTNSSATTSYHTHTYIYILIVSSSKAESVAKITSAALLFLMNA